MMLIIPAIDLINGQCVRLEQGDYHKKTVYSSDPLEMARKFEAAGAELLHLVDLDGAKAGSPQNLDIITKVAKSINIPIELGGGIRDLETVRQVLDAGVERVILGTVVLKKPAWLSTALAEYGERIVIGIDARNGMVAVEGWLETTNQSALELALEMKELGVKEIIYTDISRDGMLSGPNLAELRTMSKAGVKLVASGGVTSIDDVKQLRELETIGVYAAIVGKALYTGDLDLAEAIKVATAEVGEFQ